MSSYEKIFKDIYPNGWENKPSVNTPITAEALQDYTDTIKHIEEFLDGHELGSIVEANPELSGEEEKLKALKIDDVPYEIGNVVANPDVTEDDEALSSIQIGNIPYKIMAGGGTPLISFFPKDNDEHFLCEYDETYDIVIQRFSGSTAYNDDHKYIYLTPNHYQMLDSWGYIGIDATNFYPVGKMWGTNACFLTRFARTTSDTNDSVLVVTSSSRNKPFVVWCMFLKKRTEE